MYCCPRQRAVSAAYASGTGTIAIPSPLIDLYHKANGKGSSHLLRGKNCWKTCRLTKVVHCCSTSSGDQQASNSLVPPGKRSSLVLATRQSKLAVEQTRQVHALLAAAAQLRDEPLCISVLPMSTAGDDSPSAPLRSLGSGAFSAALDAAVAGGAADCAVHSLKDCPAVLGRGLVLGACLPRADPRDVMIAHEAQSLGELPPGSRVGTSSSRRAAQIRHAYPHLQVVPLRGSVESRLEAIRNRELGATVMALAGLQRLGLSDVASAVLSPDVMLPAACQGVVGVVCREEDSWIRKQLAAINHGPTLLEVTAERACLAALLGVEEGQEAEEEEGTQAKEEAVGGEDEAAGLRPGTTSGGDMTGGVGAAGQMFPDVAWGCNCRHDSERGSLDIDCFVSDLEGKQLIRYSEYFRPVSDPDQAAVLGHQYGTILRLTALCQGWIQG